MEKFLECNCFRSWFGGGDDSFVWMQATGGCSGGEERAGFGFMVLLAALVLLGAVWLQDGSC